MTNVIIVAGVPGAGKSSILREVAKRKSPAFRLVSFGTEMQRLYTENGLSTDRDTMRRRSIEQQQEMQWKTAENIGKLGGNILLDTHLAVKTDVGYLPGFTEKMLDYLKPKAVILVDADEAEIRGRRKLDTSRPNRIIESSEEILEHKLINRSFATIVAGHNSALLRIVQNHTGEFEEAIATIIATIDFVCNKK